MNKIFIAIIAIIAIVVAVYFIVAGFKTVDAGTRGVLLHYGQVDESQVLQEGMHIVNPVSDNIVLMPIRVQADQQSAGASSADLQDVSTQVTINYHLDPNTVQLVYEKLGAGYADSIVSPAIQEIIKAVTAKFTASQLITERAVVKQEIFDAISTRLAPYHIIVDAVSITNFQFSPGFTGAIEQKVIAVQQAEQAQNQLVTIKIQAEQKVAQANGTAQSIKIINNQLQQSPKYIEYFALQQWNGKLPQVTGTGGIPFINIQNMTK